EQGRRRHEFYRTIENSLEIAREVHRKSIDVQVWWIGKRGRAREQPEVVVGEAPALRRGQARRYGTQRRAGAAGEIHHRDRVAIADGGRDGVEHRGAARALVVGLAQRKPFGREAHATLSIAAENSAAEPRQVGRCSAAARAPAARRARSSGAAISQRNAAASAARSSGGTST